MSETYSTVYTPVITAVSVTPNPAYVGGTVTVSVSAVDVAAVASDAVYLCGEFYSGEAV